MKLQINKAIAIIAIFLCLNRTTISASVIQVDPALTSAITLQMTTLQSIYSKRNKTQPKFNTYHRRILLLLYFFSFGYGLCVLQIFIFLNGAYFSFNLSYIAVACFEGLLHCRICTMSPNGFLPSVVTSFWVLILRTISVQ